ncbi:hypothetical protein PG997_004542 [Apiospora hydei]|uniref:Uncharacterized protein n=1 Tax=Apiospora hydei TaxID=1337664 RepID=A0ABR1X2G5_9PEZI
MQDQPLSGPVSEHPRGTARKKEEEKTEGNSNVPAWSPAILADNRFAAEAPPSNAPTIGTGTASNATSELPPTYEDVCLRPVGVSSEAAPLPRSERLFKTFEIVEELLIEHVLDELSEVLDNYSKLALVDNGIYNQLYTMCGCAGFLVADGSHIKLADRAIQSVPGMISEPFNEVVQMIRLERPTTIAQVAGIMANAVTKTVGQVMMKRMYRSYLPAQAWAHWSVSTVNRQAELVCSRLAEGKLPTAESEAAPTAAPTTAPTMAPTTVQKKRKSKIKRLFERILG